MTATVLHTDTINVPAGTTVKKALDGEFLLIVEASQADLLIAFDRPETFSRMIEGMRFRARDGQRFKRVYFKNESSFDLAVEVAWGAGEIDLVLQPDRATLASFKGQAFINRNTIGGVAAQYSHVQADNPAGSSIVTIIRAIHLSVAAATRVHIIEYDGADLAAFTGLGQNLFIGRAQGVTRFYRENLVVLAAGVGGRIMYEQDFAASDTKPVELPNPIILEPDKGIIIAATTVNVAMFPNWFFEERSA